MDKSVQEIEQNLIELVFTLKYCYHVQRVAVLQILPREWPKRRIRYSVDIPWFNDRVDTLNTFLRNYFKEDRVEGVQFWRHNFGDTSAFGAQKIKNWFIQMMRYMGIKHIIIVCEQLLLVY